MKTTITLSLLATSAVLTLSTRTSHAAEAASANAPACVIGGHGGIADADAFTAASLVCDEVRAQGQPLGAPVPAETAPAGARFVVQMQPLGDSVILGLSQVDAAGRTVTVRTLNLGKIEDVPVAAPRLARAVVNGVAVEETRDVDNLVGSEARVLQKLDGETTFSVGVMTGMLVGAERSRMLVGAEGHLGYEMGAWAIDAAMRGGGASSDTDGGEGDGALFALSVGGRRFFQPGDGSLFVGTGLGFDVVETDHFDGVKPSVYAEAGYELLRLTESRLSIGLRADVLLGALEGQPDWDTRCDEFGCDSYEDLPASESGYVLPVTLSVAYAF